MKTDVTKKWKTKKVDPKIIKECFSDYKPTNLENAVKENLTTNEKEAFNSLDYIDYWFRRYLLIGSIQALRNILREARHFFLNNVILGIQFMDIMFDEAKDLIIEHEFYEMVPRYKHCKKRIKFILDEKDKLFLKMLNNQQFE